jgi:hypothetical protein
MKHLVVYGRKDRFAGWPANNGAWSWDGGEFLVGFTTGPYVVRPGHNIGLPYESHLARSLDGGRPGAWRRPIPSSGVAANLPSRPTGSTSAARGSRCA